MCVVWVRESSFLCVCAAAKECRVAHYNRRMRINHWPMSPAALFVGRRAPLAAIGDARTIRLTKIIVVGTHTHAHNMMRRVCSICICVCVCACCTLDFGLINESKTCARASRPHTRCVRHANLHSHGVRARKSHLHMSCWLSCSRSSSSVVVVVVVVCCRAHVHCCGFGRGQLLLRAAAWIKIIPRSAPMHCNPISVSCRARSRARCDSRTRLVASSANHRDVRKQQRALTHRSSQSRRAYLATFVRTRIVILIASK